MQMVLQLFTLSAKKHLLLPQCAYPGKPNGAI